ncbi:carbohydrate-binding protein [Vallitalea guaymasensis]|uniref:carbohydrate-binding protein n=1 Tax=Vallitalea guaymasensis TaxID=1185412 RepID=UPI000DE25136|nr:carbohydrate-binding protein [Vallitalea guaymasensis]
MKKTVKLLMSICLSLAMMMSFFSFNIQAADDDNVDLYYAKINTVVDHGVLQGWNVVGKIAVKNLAYRKNVVVHYTYDNKTWNDVYASYLKTSTDGYEIWTFETPLQPSNDFYYEYNCQFAIKYEVNGQTYWDNNNTKDYLLKGFNLRSLQGDVLNKCQLLVDDCYYINGLNGTIVFQDYNPTKVVTVRYTTDNWKTYKDIKAYKHPLDIYNNLETWTFKIPEIADKYEFAIMCQVNGNTFWDNNFDKNYVYTR